MKFSVDIFQPHSWWSAKNGEFLLSSFCISAHQNIHPMHVRWMASQDIHLVFVKGLRRENWDAIGYPHTFFLKDTYPQEIHEELQQICLSYFIVKTVQMWPSWSGRSQMQGQESWSGSWWVKQLVLADWRIAIREITTEMSQALGFVWTTLHEHLNMNKVSASWVPCLLSAETTEEAKRCCKLWINFFRDNAK